MTFARYRKASKTRVTLTLPPAEHYEVSGSSHFSESFIEVDKSTSICMFLGANIFFRLLCPSPPRVLQPACLGMLLPKPPPHLVAYYIRDGQDRALVQAATSTSRGGSLWCKNQSSCTTSHGDCSIRLRAACGDQRRLIWKLSLSRKLGQRWAGEPGNWSGTSGCRWHTSVSLRTAQRIPGQLDTGADVPTGHLRPRSVIYK